MTMTTALEEFLQHDDDTYYSRPTPEEGHTKRCLASAIISAVENLRDDDSITDHDFALYAQDNFLHIAVEYINSEITECHCPQRLRHMTYSWVVHFVNVDDPDVHLDDPDSYESWVLFGTLEDVILTALDYRYNRPGFPHVRIGRQAYGDDDPLEFFWESYDAPLIQAS